MRLNTVKRWQLLKVYTIIKQRLFSTLQDSKNEEYSVRQEYYIIIGLLKALKEGDIDAVKLPALSVVGGQGVASKTAKHTLYWVLPTNKVNAFAAIKMNWWLFGLKVIISKVNVGHNS